MSADDHTRAIVDAYYQAGVRDDLPAFARYVAENFSVTAPNYLPWGGTHHGKAFFADNVLAHLPETLDFAAFHYDDFVVQGEHAVALITIGVAGSSDTVQISEHWRIRGGLAQSLWVAYFQPQALLAKLGVVHRLPTFGPSVEDAHS